MSRNRLPSLDREPNGRVRRKRAPQHASRSIYVVDCETDDLIKIGSSRQLTDRIAHLEYERGTVRTMRLRWVMHGDDEAVQVLEKAIHLKLKGRAIHGRQWYRFDANGAIEVVKKMAREMGVDLWPDPQTGATFRG